MPVPLTIKINKWWRGSQRKGACLKKISKPQTQQNHAAAHET